MEVGARAGSPAVATAARDRPRDSSAAPALAEPEPPEGSSAATDGCERGCGGFGGSCVAELGEGGSGGAVGEAWFLVEGVPGSNGVGEDTVRRVVAERRHARCHRRRRGSIGIRVWAGERT